MTTYKPQDRVALSAKFLRSIGIRTGDAPFARGVVDSVRKHLPGVQALSVTWDGGWPDGLILSTNVTLVSAMAADALMAEHVGS